MVISKKTPVVVATPTDRAKAARAAIAQIRKTYGDEAIRYLDANIAVDVISTGAVTLDLALGVGGIPKGRITEIFGQEGCGKTTLTFHMIAECQKAGGIAAFIDTEHALDPAYAKRCGVRLAPEQGGDDEDGMHYLQPDSGEDVFDLILIMIRSGAYDLIVIDSMAALIPTSELEGEMGDQQIGAQARMISKGLKKVIGPAANSNTAIVFTNQTRVDIGAWSPRGTPMTTSGGKAPKFYAGVRIELKRGSHIKEGDRVIGHGVTATVVKNKVAPPFVKAEYQILFPNGIDKVGGAFDAAVKLDIVERSGATYTFQGEKIGIGRENVISLLRANEPLLEKIADAIRHSNKRDIVVEEVEPRPEEL